MDPMPFEMVWNWQRNWQSRLIEDPLYPQAVWLLQHQNCYTIGRGGSERNLLFDSSKPPFDLFRIDRGGEVTHHAPGQLVAYSVLDLHRYKTDVDWYLRALENLLIDVIGSLGLQGEKLPGLTGIWVNGFKVAAIGIGGRRWITQHGLALNVDCDLSGFEQVIPCGLRKHEVGRLSTWLPGLTVSDVQPLIRKAFVNHFQLNWKQPKPVQVF